MLFAVLFIVVKFAPQDVTCEVLESNRFFLKSGFIDFKKEYPTVSEKEMPL